MAPSRHKPPRPRAPHLGLLALGLALLAACNATAASTKAPRPGPRPTSGPGVGKASPAPASPQAPASSAVPSQPEGQASAAAATALRLPLRLSVVLPKALVGAEGAARLLGQDGLVGRPGSQLYATADGRIVSNNSGAIVSNNSGSIVSNNSGSLISDAGGGLISDQGGNLISDQGGAWRLTQAEAAPTRDAEATAPVKKPLTDPRMRLWLILALQDFSDQLLKAYVDAKPALNRWARFNTARFTFLPTPFSIPSFEVLGAGSQARLRGLHLAGLMQSEATGARLRVLALPQAGAPLREGLPILDLAASGEGVVGRCRFVPELEALFGFQNSASSLSIQPGGAGLVLESVLAETAATNPEPTSLGAVLNEGELENTRRVLRLEAHSPSRASAFLASSAFQQVVGKPRVKRSQRLIQIGYDPKAREEGLALIRRERSAINGAALPPFTWDLPFGAVGHGDLPVWPFYLLPAGFYSNQGPASLQALVPPFALADEARFLPIPEAGEDPAEGPGLKPEPLSEALLALPEGP